MVDSGWYKRLTQVLICLALALLTLTVFWSVKDADFINYDDNVYVYENAYVKSGLQSDSIRAAFSSELVQKVTNWHPLTWLSLMLDASLFGLNPSGYHWVNLFLHILNTLLLFLILRRMTRSFWPGAVVACLFAIHPLHVESVAWVAERKDVLSGFFWMLTLGAYSFYVERPSFRRYAPVFLFFALGLLAKPMNVTLPFVLLLLDYWPLRRLQAIDPKETADQQPKPAGFEARRSSVAFLLLEKVPLLVLSVILCIVTYLAAQAGGAVASFDVLPLGVRIGHTFVSYAAYLGKMIWPVSLAVYYPHPGVVIPWQVAGSVILLAAITLLVFWRIKKSPYLATGWLWYLGTLVPVIGLVQNGDFAMADRYTYIPLVGLFIMLAWGAADLLKNRKHAAKILAAVSAVCIIGLSVLAWIQVGYWQDSLSLYDHTLNITDNNWIIYNNRAVIHNHSGNYQGAIEDSSRAIEITPNRPQAYNNRGNAYFRIGNFRQAIEDYTSAIRIQPKAEFYNNRGNAYARLGNFGQAVEDFTRTIELAPDHQAAYFSRGAVYLNLGDRISGCRDAQKACQLGTCRLLESARFRGDCP